VVDRHRLEQPEDFWDIVLGSGYRATVDALDEAQRVRLRDDVLARLREADVTEIRSDVVFGMAAKPTF